MRLAVFLFPLVVLGRVVTARGPVVVTGPPITEFGLVVKGRFTIVVHENFSFTIVKFSEEK